MTKKRFTLDEDGNITDTKNDRCLYVENRLTECDYFVDLLNEQHEELGNRKRIIKAITNDYKELEQAKNSLLKENEQLKSTYGEMEDYLARLEEENEQLKSFIKRLTSCDGKIYLMNGMAYNTKVLNFEPKK